MSDKDTQRIVMARAMMWDRARGDEQAKWLRRVDDLLASLERAAARPRQEPSEQEGQAYPPLRVAR